MEFVFSLSFIVFYLTHLWIKYLKFWGGLGLRLVGVFKEYNYCYACVGFWFGVIFTIFVRGFVEEFSFFEKVFFSFIVSLSVLYNLNTSVLFENVRKNGFLYFGPHFFLPFTSLVFLLISFFYPKLFLPLFFAFSNVLIKAAFEKLGVYEEI